MKNIRKYPLFEFIWFRNFGACLAELAEQAMPEHWDYKNAPTGRYPILFNYLHHTFSKLKEEAKIELVGQYGVFNSGLVTNNHEDIYGFFQKTKNAVSAKPYFFIGWMKSSERELLKFPRLPEGADYIKDSTDLIYNLKTELRVNIDHIIQDNRLRFPSSVLALDDHQIASLLQGTIEDAKKRVKRNYKTAIPQYYKGKLQLLLPLCLVTRTKADLALVVEKENSVYRASTCLTLDMAINNARLIAKPDDEWLKP
jgi:hypothetical protein